MNKVAFGFIILLISMVIIVGCSNSGMVPVLPDDQPQTSHQQKSLNNSSQTHLWGLWDVMIDIETREAEAILNRSAMFTANCVTFLNKAATGLSFHINDIINEPDYVDVDIDVGLTHPFPGLPEYHGYDVRGVFMGNGSAALNYNSSLLYPTDGLDQTMFPDPVDGYGGPDGYTRWFNYSEFGHPTMPLFGYTQGKMASPGFSGSATLCPYRYFADGLETNQDLWTWLEENSDKHGRFSSGATNDRNYYLRFPTPVPDVKYGYAVVANWEGDQPEHHPSNAPEAVACMVDDSSDVYYVDDSVNGGNLILDISIWNWDAAISAGIMEDYTLFIESTVLGSVHGFNPTEMTPADGDEHYSTYHVEIPADDASCLEGNEYWVIAECADVDYSNEFDILNDAWDEPLAAFFRYHLDVSNEAPNPCDIVIDPDSPDMPYEGWATYFTFDASGSGGGPNTYEWDFDNDGVFGDLFENGTDEKPVKYFDFTNQEQVCVRVTNPGGQSECCVYVDIVTFPSKNIPLRDDAEAWDLAIDPSTARILILYDDVTVWQYLLNDYYSVPTPDGIYYDTHWDDMDPWPGHEFYISKGYMDCMDNGYFVVNFAWNPGYWVDRAWYDVVDPSANQVVRHSPSANWSVSYSTYEIMAWGETGPYANNVGMAWGTSVPGSFNYVSTSTGSSNWSSTQYYSNWYTSGPQYGYDKFMGVWTRGGEVDIDDTHFWTVERVDYYAARWELGATGFNNNGIVYNNAHFGTGAQTDNDDGFNDPKDLTRDDLNQYMVLDKLSDDTPRIKAYDVSSMPVTSLGGMDLDGITDPAFRIDSSDFIDPDFGNYLIILHGDETEGYFISVFFPNELPW